MAEIMLPDDYSSVLSRKETQKAVAIGRDYFRKELGDALNLVRIPCPLIVPKSSGINDDLNGIERKVEFSMANIDGTAEIVQSLAKWKRVALYKYGYEPGEGIYTNMNAIRRDDDCDALHSIFVDQWDWERVITKDERNINFLKSVVSKLVNIIADTKLEINRTFPQLTRDIERNVFFITSQELEDRYPNLTPKERENKITEEYGTVFLMQIGDILKSGEKHDGRAPDYDDWALNGDILLWNDVLKGAIEVSSMGIRVDANSLKEQLIKCNETEKLKYKYHQGIMDGSLPLTIGGGIGQSRIMMYILEKAHIGEVQVSIWPDEMIDECKKHNIHLL